MNRSQQGVDLNKTVNAITSRLSAPQRSSRSNRGGRNTNRSQTNAVRRVQGAPSDRNRTAQRLDSIQDVSTAPLNLFNIGPGSTPGGVRVRGKELVGSVTATTALTGQFALANTGSFQAFPVNPYSFPRLQAYNTIYEYFKFHKMFIEFKPNQPTTEPGEILICLDYDSTDSVPTSSIAMMRNISASMANIYSKTLTQLDGSLSRLPKYETYTASPSELIQQLQANLFVATEGVTADSGAILGYIVIGYDVEFFTPQ